MSEIINENEQNTEEIGDEELLEYAESLKTAKLRNLYIISIFIVLAMLLIACLVFFFNIKTIEVRGVTLYGDEQIQIVGGVQSGQNLIRLDTDTVEKRLKDNLVYVEEAKVEQKFPSTLVITVTEAEKAVDIEENGAYYVVSSSGKMLERSNPKPTGNIPVITGFELKSTEPGQELESKDSLKTDILSELLQYISELHFKKVTYIDMKDRADIKILYDNRIEIKLGSSVDIENKLTGIKAVIDAQKPGYEGTIIYNSVDSGISASAKEKGSVSEIDHGTAGDKNKDTEQNDVQDEQNNGEAQDNGTQDQWTDQGGDEQYPADNNTDGWTDNGQNGTDNGQTGTDTWTDDGTWQDNGEAQYWQGQGDAGWIPDGGGQAW